MRAKRPVWPAAAAGFLIGGAIAASALVLRDVLPADASSSARGVTVDGRTIEWEDASAAFVHAHAERMLDRAVFFSYGGERLLSTSLRDLRGTVNEAEARASVLRIAHDGSLLRRIDDALEARRGHIDVRLAISLPVDDLSRALERAKEERDVAPMAAKLLFASDGAQPAATAHQPGKYLDLFAAVAAVDGAFARDPWGEAPIDVEIPAFEIVPKASAEEVAKVDASQVISRFTTQFGFVGGQQNRAQNIRRAASQMDGVVLMPGSVISFNANVGPRSIENGFATAPEIYKGEMREGVGGGTCQVAGTLHAAAYLGGLSIVERANHSRPSGYIGIGLDATVVYPTTDLKLGNPFSFPVVIHDTIDKGTLVFEIRGREKVATVTYATETTGHADFKRKIEEAPWLGEGKFKLKQKGRAGFSLRKTRVIHLLGGSERVEVTNDTYPPTFEIWMIGPGTDPDTALPALGTTTANDEHAA